MATKKETAVSFLQMAASGRVREAYDEHIGSGFRHHNPFFAGSAEALMAGMEETQQDRGAVVVHIFRFVGDRIVEVWDVGQPIPEEVLNTHGML